MTQEQFNMLPLLLRRSQVLAATGLASRTISALVVRQQLRVVHVPSPDKPTSTQSRFLKTDVAKLAGLRS